MRGRLAILAVTSELPWPLTSGGRLRTYHLLKALGAQHDVSLVVPVDPGRRADIAPLAQAGFQIRAVAVPETGRVATLTAAAMAAARSRPFVMYGRHDRAAVREALAADATRRAPDVWYFDHLDSFVYAPLAGTALVAGDMHNVYSTLAARTADEQPSAVLRRYLRREARLLECAEISAAARADVLFAVSNDDANVFRAHGARRVEVAPNGVDVARYADLPAARRGRPPTVLYLGAMSWVPNASAAVFLAREVMPQVRQRVPGARLMIVGRDPTADVRALETPGFIEVTGSVPDVRPYFEAAHVLAVPLDAGGGTRIKILEAFAAGVPVVSTRVGCEGIEARPDEQIVVAERDEFARAIADVLSAPDRAATMAERARALARQRYGWLAIGDRVAATLAEAVQATAGASGKATA